MHRDTGLQAHTEINTPFKILRSNRGVSRNFCLRGVGVVQNIPRKFHRGSSSKVGSTSVLSRRVCENLTGHPGWDRGVRTPRRTLPRGVATGWTGEDTSTPLFSDGVSGIESLWSVLISFRLYPQTLLPTWEGTPLPTSNPVSYTHLTLPTNREV